MTRPDRVLLWTLALVLTGGMGAGEAQQSLRDTADVVWIEIPVHVARKGEPVTGLTASDFEVRDRGKRLELVAFDVIDLDATAYQPDAIQAVPISGRRHFLLLFDLALSLVRDPESGSGGTRTATLEIPQPD